MANEKVLVAKQAVIDEITDKLTNAQSVVVAEYRGLTVDEVTELRRALRAENVELKVYKNKLALRATEACGKQELDEFLTGPNAIAFGHDDAVAPARVLAKFAKDHEALVIKTAIVEGKLLSKEEVMELSKLPNKEGMLSMLLACLKAPVSKKQKDLQKKQLLQKQKQLLNIEIKENIKMAKLTTDEILAYLEEATILELNELVKAIEEKFDVTAAAPVAVAAAAEEEGPAANVTVILKEVGPTKVKVIKAVREITGLGLVDAKGLVDKVPSEIKKDVPAEEGAKLKETLEAAGAVVELK